MLLVWLPARCVGDFVPVEDFVLRQSARRQQQQANKRSDPDSHELPLMMYDELSVYERTSYHSCRVATKPNLRVDSTAVPAIVDLSVVQRKASMESCALASSISNFA